MKNVARSALLVLMPFSYARRSESLEELPSSPPTPGILLRNETPHHLSIDTGTCGMCSTQEVGVRRRREHALARSQRDSSRHPGCAARSPEAAVPAADGSKLHRSIGRSASARRGPWTRSRCAGEGIEPAPDRAGGEVGQRCGCRRGPGGCGRGRALQRLGEAAFWGRALLQESCRGHRGWGRSARVPPRIDRGSRLSSRRVKTRRRRARLAPSPRPRGSAKRVNRPGARTKIARRGWAEGSGSMVICLPRCKRRPTASGTAILRGET